jgi:hypothetical protein
MGVVYFILGGSALVMVAELTAISAVRSSLKDWVACI